MCASDNAIVIVLDPNIGYTTGTSKYDIPTSTWRLSFPYGTITGISSCLNYSSNQSSVANNGSVFGGEQNGYYCWCKMTHPAVSKWILYNAIGGNTTDCNNLCARNCVGMISAGTSGDTPNLKKFFQTIAN